MTNIQAEAKRAASMLADEYSAGRRRLKGPAQIGIKAVEPMGQNLEDAFDASRRPVRDDAALIPLKLELSTLQARFGDEPSCCSALLSAVLSLAEKAASEMTSEQISEAVGLGLQKRPQDWAGFVRRMKKTASKAQAGAKHLRAHPSSGSWDGLLISRENAFRLGAASYARSLSPAMTERIAEAFKSAAEASSGSYWGLQAGIRAWSEGRTFLFIDRINSLTMKLAIDMWLADKSIAVVLRSRAGCVNPFEEFRIPFIVDSTGAVSSLLSVAAYPSIVQRIFGGVSVTSTLGPFQPIKSKSRFAKAVPEWFRMFSIVGLISLIERMNEPRPEAFLRPLHPQAARACLEALLGLRTMKSVRAADPKLAEKIAGNRIQCAKELEKFLKLLEGGVARA